MKFLGLDVGTKRIGVAKADASVKIATPITTVEVNGQELAEIARLARLEGASSFVIGLPRSNEGVETKQSEWSREFAKKLRKSLPEAKIFLEDESLTSIEAEERLKARKAHFEKGEIDAEAASIILQSFIENFNEERPSDV